MEIELTQKQAEHVDWALGGMDELNGTAEEISYSMDLTVEFSEKVSEAAGHLKVRGNKFFAPEPSLAASYLISDIGYRLTSQLRDMARGEGTPRSRADARNALVAWEIVQTAWLSAGGQIDHGIVNCMAEHELQYD